MAFDLPANGSGDRNVKSEAEQCVGLKSDWLRNRKEALRQTWAESAIVSVPKNNLKNNSTLISHHQELTELLVEISYHCGWANLRAGHTIQRVWGEIA
jgi:hypothetical protein